jgi:hypothetical protein
MSTSSQTRRFLRLAVGLVQRHAAATHPPLVAPRAATAAATHGGVLARLAGSNAVAATTTSSSATRAFSSSLGRSGACTAHGTWPQLMARRAQPHAGIAPTGAAAARSAGFSSAPRLPLRTSKCPTTTTTTSSSRRLFSAEVGGSSGGGGPAASTSTTATSGGGGGGGGSGRKSPITFNSMLLAAAAFLGVVAVAQHKAQERVEGMMQKSQKVVGKAAVGGPFSLVDQDGKPFTHQNLVGKWTVLYFGFCHCPDICPDELEKLAEAIDLIEARVGEQIQPVFVTIDPQRDTAAKVGGVSFGRGGGCCHRGVSPCGWGSGCEQCNQHHPSQPTPDQPASTDACANKHPSHAPHLRSRLTSPSSTRA